MPRLPVMVLLLALLVPATAGAQQPPQSGDPIMPLSEVAVGMRCTAWSVVRGTDVVPFDAEVLDVVTGDAADRAPRLLIRVSGPNIDATGVGPGFSGSPIYCPDAEGNHKNAGAVSEGIGDYGNKVVLATPIEAIIGEFVDPPSGATSDPALLRRARPLATPLTFSGVSGPVAGGLRRAALALKRPIATAPAAPRASFPVQELKPGAAVAVSLSSGDLTSGGIGTVAYSDAGRVWAFGHPLDGVGRRNLFLQDAYVYGVINNPLGSGEANTYKLAASGHDVGTLTNDAPSAITGRVGALPDRFPMKIIATDVDTKRQELVQVQIADETPVGVPSGISSLTQVAPVALAQATYTILRGSPTRQMGSMCVRVALRERRKPLRFCNTYAGGGGPGAAGAPLVADMTQALSLLDAYALGPLHVTGVEANVKLGRGLRQAFITKLRGPDVVRRGRTYRIRATLRRRGGGTLQRTLRVRVPRGLPTGDRELALTGTPSDGVGGGGGAEEDLGEVFTISLGGEAGDEQGPRSLSALAREFADIARYDGVEASFPEPGAPTGRELEAEGENLPSGAEGIALRGRETYREEGLRISGEARLDVFVR